MCTLRTSFHLSSSSFFSSSPQRDWTFCCLVQWEQQQKTFALAWLEVHKKYLSLVQWEQQQCAFAFAWLEVHKKCLRLVCNVVYLVYFVCILVLLDFKDHSSHSAVRAAAVHFCPCLAGSSQKVPQLSAVAWLEVHKKFLRLVCYDVHLAYFVCILVLCFRH